MHTALRRYVTRGRRHSLIECDLFYSFYAFKSKNIKSISLQTLVTNNSNVLLVQILVRHLIDDQVMFADRRLQ